MSTELTIPAGALRLARIARTGTIRATWSGDASSRCHVVATITAAQARTVGLRTPPGAAEVVLGEGERPACGGGAVFSIVLARPVRDALVKAGTSLRVRLRVTVDGATPTTRVVTLRR
ncbi:MAG: hypothetical protein JWP17_2201 [Solirubrobacterales bacterium]|jgi:hypothetical protein|nr:hypothetical protein [Solirubrobacterales bacterium]